MSSPKPDVSLVDQLKAQHGPVLVVEFGELGWYVLKLFTSEAFADHVDRAAAGDEQNVRQRTARMHVLYPAPGVFAVDRMRKPGLPSKIVTILCEMAGIPGGGGSLADTWEDELTDGTAPAAPERAGLAPEQAAKLLASAERKLTVVSISDRFDQVIFGGVLAEPTEVEAGMVADMKKQKKGIQRSMRSIVESCLVWSKEPLDVTIARYPGVVTMLMMSIAERLEVADLNFFRG